MLLPAVTKQTKLKQNNKRKQWHATLITKGNIQTELCRCHPVTALQMKKIVKPHHIGCKSCFCEMLLSRIPSTGAGGRRSRGDTIGSSRQLQAWTRN